jgi:hypothetical protein
LWCEAFFAYGFTGLKFLSSFDISTGTRSSGMNAEAGAGVSVTAVPPKNATAQIIEIVFLMVAPSPELFYVLAIDCGRLH